GRKSSYGLLMLVPYLNIFIFAALAVDLARSFGRFNFLEFVAAVVGAPFYFGWLGRQDPEYRGPVMEQERNYLAKLKAAKKAGDKREFNKLARQNPFKKPSWQEWVESAVFAVFAATLIRLLFIEPYIIPTPSMEGSLMVGDFLFVSKVHYGMRLPETVLQLPLVHNRAPFVGGESYLEKPSLPYRRLPAIENIDRYDPVVFNMPAGDSVYVFPDRVYTDMDYKTGAIHNPRYVRRIETGRTKLVTRPRDKKDLYVKRAVGLPGDTLEIRNRDLYIDGKRVEHPSTVQFLYNVAFSAAPNQRNWANWGIAEDDVHTNGSAYSMFLNSEQIEQLKEDDPNLQIEHMNFDRPQFMGRKMYPHNARYNSNWSNDNYGPIWIPKAGSTVTLTPQNFDIYYRPIKIYEGNTIERRGNQFVINGEVTNSSIPSSKTYWLMGDNRHNSEDSRVWGFVPMDHVVGKPLFIWFSLRENSFAKGINWSRIFTSAAEN
ncbi:MAG: signal peptidase I, partial [Bacteroidota bacterium]